MTPTPGQAPAPAPAEPAAAAAPDVHRKPTPLQTTDVGLPKRTRRAHLMPQLRGRSQDTKTAPGLAGPRSPEEVRSMMSSFQTNFDRGLQDAPQPDEAGDQDT